MTPLGKFRIDRVVEYEGPFIAPIDLFPDYDPEVLDAIREWSPPLLDAHGKMLMSFHSFVLRTGRHTILVDTCFGNDKERVMRPHGHRIKSGYLGSLAQVGLQPEDIDFVMCTHLHWDHVGWNTRLVNGQWVPTFPNARYIMARKEYEHWDAMYAKGDTSIHSVGFGDSVLPVMRAERAVLVEDDHAVEDGVWLEPCPGHTPGNVVINLQSAGARGVFSGDVLHSPFQLARPEWSSRACTDLAASAVSRRKFIDQHADTGNLVMPAHFAAPSWGCIVRHGATFAFKSG